MENKFISTEASQNIVSFSVISNQEGLLTKTIKPDRQGGIIKTPAAQLCFGSAETVRMPLKKFGPFLRTLKSNQALVHGVSDHDSSWVVSAKNYTGQAGTITRTKEFFHYPDSPGLLMFDYDKPRSLSVSDNKGALKSYTPNDLIKLISKIFPEIASAGWVSTPSTSSCINDKDGKELRGEGSGSHIYFAVVNGRDIPRFLKVLGKRLFLAGYGRVEISRSGALLFRTLVDLTVGSPDQEIIK